MLKKKSIILILALTASLPVMVNYNIVGEELLLYLMEAEAVLGFSIDSVYRWLVLLVNVITAGVAYVSFTKCFQSSTIGILGCALYTLAPYRLHLLYVRSAVGEYIAMIFLPLLVWGIHGICCGNRKEKGYLWNWLVLAIGLWGTIHPYIIGVSIGGQRNTEAAMVTPVDMDGALLLCVLLWIGLLLKYGSEVLSKEQKRERGIANLALIAGVILWIVDKDLTGVSTICLLVTACVMGRWLLREEKSVLSGKSVLYGVVVMALVFGAYQVNDILMTSGNIMFVP